MARSYHVLYMSTDFVTDSSSRFPVRARTNRQTDRRDRTPYHMPAAMEPKWVNTSTIYNTEIKCHKTLPYKDTQRHAVTWLHRKRLYCVEYPQYSIRLEGFGYLCTSCLLSLFDEA